MAEKRLWLIIVIVAVYIFISVAVVVAFFLCWAPFHAQRLLAVYGSTDDNTPKNHTFYIIYTVLTHISGVTFFLSTCINPLLYSVMSYKFRNAFKVSVIVTVICEWMAKLIN